MKKYGDTKRQSNDPTGSTDGEASEMRVSHSRVSQKHVSDNAVKEEWRKTQT